MARIDKTKRAIEEAGIKGVQLRPSDITVNSVPIEIDLYIEEKKTALKVMESNKIQGDLRFIREKNILESNRLLLLGDEKYTLAK